MKWLDLVKQLAPIVVGVAVPHGAQLAPIVTDAIAESEQLFGPGTGADKKAHALQLTTQVANAVNVAKGRPVLDAHTIAAVDEAIDTAVEITNVVHAAHGASAASTSPPAAAGA